MTKEKNFQVISGFILKIIAIVLMTIDHIGIFLQNYENTMQIAIIFRDLGRIAFPLFLFLIVEGVRHTRSFGKYILKLGILGAIFMVGQVVIYYNFNNRINDFYSPILDLILVALIIYLIDKKNNLSLLAVLPVIYIAISFIVVNVEKSQHITILWMPFFLRVPYAILDIVLGLSFYFAKPVSKFNLKSSDNTSALVDTKYQRYCENILSSFAIIFFVIILYIIYLTTGITYWSDSSQIYAALAFIPLLFYSGERGYNKKWFKYGCYLYIPLHLLIIYLIFSFI